MLLWPLFAQPRHTRAVVLAVDAVAVALVLAQASGGPPCGRALAGALVLAVLGVVHAELAVGVERVRLLVARPAHVSLTSVWTFAAALYLAPPLATAVVVLVQAYVWLRTGRSRWPLYKHVFSTATVVLACTAAGMVNTAAPGGGGVVTILCAMAAYATVNSALVAAAVLQSVASPDLATLFGDWDDNILEVATLALGALVAKVIAINPWLVAFVLPPVLVLHRAVVVRRLEEAASTDGKTGLLNARTWSARAAARLRRAARRRSPHVVLVLDLDHFKAVNDHHGHLAGDQVLAAVASALQAEVRGRDLVGRFGGEEFVVLLGGLRHGGEAELAAVAERIRERVSSLWVEVATPKGMQRIADLSVSVGGAIHPGGRADLEGLLRTADTALYSAKRAGRNQVRMALVPPEG